MGLHDIFYLSGIFTNIGIMYFIYFKLPDLFGRRVDIIKREAGVLLKSEEQGEIYNLHSSQSVGHIIDKEKDLGLENERKSCLKDREDELEEKLRKISDSSEKDLGKNWYDYFPGLVSKKNV